MGAPRRRKGLRTNVRRGAGQLARATQPVYLFANLRRRARTGTQRRPYSCDHYVEPGYLLGNIQQTSMAELVTSEKQRAFGLEKLDNLPKYCRECEVRFACHGECPRNRFITTPDGEPGLNYLCAGYKQFFNHIDPAMKTMAALLRQGRFADEI